MRDKEALREKRRHEFSGGPKSSSPGALNYIRMFKGKCQRSCPCLHYALSLAFVLFRYAVLASLPSAPSRKSLKQRCRLRGPCVNTARRRITRTDPMSRRGLCAQNFPLLRPEIIFNERFEKGLEKGGTCQKVSHSLKTKVALSACVRGSEYPLALWRCTVIVTQR